MSLQPDDVPQMTGERNLETSASRSVRPHLMGMLAGLFLAAGLVCSSALVARAWQRIAESQAITVTGSARKPVKSDLIVWSGIFTAEAGSLLEAQRVLKADRGKVDAFLRGQGISNHVFEAIDIKEMRPSPNRVLTDEESGGKVTSYRLSQAVMILSSQVERVARLDQEATVLVEQGVFFISQPPQFIYTKAGEAKIDMLAEATRDARARAEQIAAQGARAIRELRSAKMGVFQIAPLHRMQTSWEGVNDTTTMEKTITAVVTATFSLK